MLELTEIDGFVIVFVLVLFIITSILSGIFIKSKAGPLTSFFKSLFCIYLAGCLFLIAVAIEWLEFYPLVDGLLSAFHVITGWSSSALDAIISWSSSALDAIISWSSSALDAIISWSSSALDAIISWSSSALDAIISWSSSALDAIFHFIAGLVEWLGTLLSYLLLIILLLLTVFSIIYYIKFIKNKKKYVIIPIVGLVITKKIELILSSLWIGLTSSVLFINYVSKVFPVTSDGLRIYYTIDHTISKYFLVTFSLIFYTVLAGLLIELLQKIYTRYYIWKASPSTSDRELLLFILEAIEKIDRYTSKGKDVFLEDELIQTWIIYHFLVIGEAANQLSDSLRKKHHGIPCSDIVAMRNILVHHCFRIDLENIWNTTNIDLPVLKANVEKILKDFDSGEDRSGSAH